MLGKPAGELCDVGWVCNGGVVCGHRTGQCRIVDLMSARSRSQASGVRHT